MTPRSLRTLVAIAEHGTFQAAARRLNLTLSGVSMQMKALESELAAALFDRATRPPRLTPLGRAVAGRARALLAVEEEIRALCAPDLGLAGDYRIGFIQTASVRILPGFLARAARLAPEARFAVETGLSERLERAVAEGRLDAAIVTRSDTAPAALNATVLATEELVLALPPGAGALDLAGAMARLPFLQFAPGTGIGRLVARHLAERGIVPGRRILLDGIEAILECVSGGLGFTVLPRPDVRRYAGPGVSLRPLADPPLTREVVLVTLAGSATDRCRGLLADCARGPGAIAGGAETV